MAALEELSPAQQALIGYMRYRSEDRWCAGWLHGLEEVLVGDPAYDWLVVQAGGCFRWKNDDDDPDEVTLFDGDALVWLPV